MISTNEIRRKFLNFFNSKGHEIIRSSSLIPKDDPSLLFTNAGMVQFKSIFQGLEKRNYTRATSSQKCLRVGGKHNDLENVGRTARHHTFFEMLGNFSFGDYFKEDAIKYAWEFLTEVLTLPKDKLWATVYQDDDEAIELWLKHSSIPKERILRLGEKDNFWSMGDTGPCGPCSEILIDQGEHMTCGPNCGIGKCDCDRFLEIWNLVFMQFNQLEDGTRENLPSPSIDTGMGLERISAVCQKVYSNYDADLFHKLIEHAAELAKVSYSHSRPDTNDTDTSLRVIADHSRSIAFMIADGIMPSNEGRGYVLRRLIRRAYRFGKLIHMPDSFLYLCVNKVVELMAVDFPELSIGKDFMLRMVKEEEERFCRTLEHGLKLLEEELATLETQKVLSLTGDIAFKLYDTYGFPLDIVNDIAQKRGINIDEQGYQKLMQEQRNRAKNAWKGSGETDPAARFAELLEEGIHSTFIGYHNFEVNNRITVLMNNQGLRVTSLKQGEQGWLVSGQTPFYGEGGGQIGDIGTLSTASGNAKVLDSQKASNYLTVKLVKVTAGKLLLDEEVQLNVDVEERLASARNHTCTHLLHKALQTVLGEHARQSGSLVSPNRLRFDFTHIAAMTPEELGKVEHLVNKEIMDNNPIIATECSYDEAIANGATALFGEKYGDLVRQVSVADVTTELCGGTHLEFTGQAGFFTILSESGIAAGIRRIEAASGLNALKIHQELKAEEKDLMSILKAKQGEVASKVKSLQEEVRSLRKSLEKSMSEANKSSTADLEKASENLNGLKLLILKTEAKTAKNLRSIAEDIKSRLSNTVACLSAEEDGKVSLVITVSDDLVSKLNAGNLIKELAPLIDGSGGGKTDLAQAGGTNATGLESAFAKLREILKS